MSNQEGKRLIIVDDEESVTSSLSLLLKRNFLVQTAATARKALELINVEAPDLLLLDVLLPDKDGIELLRELREVHSFPVIMLTSSNTVRTAVEAMKLGAVDYLTKPFDIGPLTTLINEVLAESESIPVPNASLPDERKAPSKIVGDFGDMIGESPAMRDVFKRISMVAGKDTTILILGDSGTGKELVARRIHELSRRSSGPFIAVNCAAIPETLIESELFGHERGAFTHAVERRLGHCELADGGTLFLDEIGELSLNVQVKLLRFLQEQEFYRVGRSKPIKVDVRIVTATNRNLETLIQEKKFRQDLYYRIHVVSINMPRLSERVEDIMRLALHFVEKYRSSYGGRILSFSDEVVIAMQAYQWPGNVRELENFVEALMALSPNDEVTIADLPVKFLDLQGRFDKGSGVGGALVQGVVKYEDAAAIFESEMIIKALKRAGYVQTKAAELLGISRRILKYKMDKLGISDDMP
jgi:DNA-binding NtrC family response regulator